MTPSADSSREREHEFSEGCWCGPRVDHVWHGRVIAHNFDSQNSPRDENLKSC
jgi:hypothetical protein